MKKHVTIFTKGRRAFEEAPALLIPRLIDAGCLIEDYVVKFLTHQECRVHYAKLVGGPYYGQTQSIFDTCPSHFFRVFGDPQVIISIVGEDTDPKNCSQNTIRYILGTGKDNNVLHRSTLEEADDDDKRFWDPVSGFISQYRRDPLAQKMVEEWLHEHNLAEAKIKKVVFATDLLRKHDPQEFISLVGNTLTEHGIQIIYGFYAQMTVGEVSVLEPNSYQPGSHAYEEFIERYTLDKAFQFFVQGSEEQIGKLLPRVSATTEERSKFSSCSALLVKEYGPDLPGWCWSVKCEL